MSEPVAGAHAAAALRHVKRARGLLRESARHLAQAGQLDTVAHLTVRTTSDTQEASRVLLLALTEHRELDVIVIAATTPQLSGPGDTTP